MLVMYFFSALKSGQSRPGGGEWEAETEDFKSPDAVVPSSKDDLCYMKKQRVLYNIPWLH